MRGEKPLPQTCNPEPYRILTSRAEYRLLLRQDNADTRLFSKAKAIGLISERRISEVASRVQSVQREIKRLGDVSVSSKAMEAALGPGGAADGRSLSLLELLRRPEVGYDQLWAVDPDRPRLAPGVSDEIEAEVKYEGYIKRQLSQVARFAKMESRRIPSNVDFSQIDGVSAEAREKLSRVRPESFGQASRISGVTPADMVALAIYLEKLRQKGTQAAS
jgi:tRNA uridine 5-carboxymethylaminomethyl modification enzyme